MANSGPDFSVGGFTPSRKLVAVFSAMIVIAGSAGLIKGLITPFANPWRELDAGPARAVRQPVVPTATALPSNAALGAFLVVSAPKPNPPAAQIDQAVAGSEPENTTEELASVLASELSSTEQSDKAAKKVSADSEAAPAPVQPAAPDTESAV